MYALVCQHRCLSLRFNPNKHRPGYRTEIYFPRCAEKSDFETVAGAKQTAMVPVEFQAYKSMTTGKSNLIRMTKSLTRRAGERWKHCAWRSWRPPGSGTSCGG